MITKRKFFLMRLRYSLAHPIIAWRTLWNWGTLPIPRLLPPPPGRHDKPTKREFDHTLTSLRREFYDRLNEAEQTFWHGDLESTRCWLEAATDTLKMYQYKLSHN